MSDEKPAPKKCPECGRRVPSCDHRIDLTVALAEHLERERPRRMTLTEDPMTRAKAYGQLRSEVSRLVNKTRPMPVGAEVRRLIDRLASEALRIDAMVEDHEPVGADWIRRHGSTRRDNGRAS